MARLLRNLDYLRVIQSNNFDQVIESNEQIRLDVEQAAQAEMISYLTQRYDVSKIFTNTTQFSISATYKAKNLIYWTETAFSATTVYTTGQRVSYLGYIYTSIAGSVAHAWNASEWTLLGTDMAFYYVTLPYSEYDSTVTYAIGNQIWYNDKTYTCLIANTNVLPTNAAFWGTGVAYSVTGQLPSVTAKWTVGDNRNPLIVLYLLDITLYHIHSRINPHTIPDLRKERYNGNNVRDESGALGWLNKIASGTLTADLPVISPVKGNSIRWGNADGSTSRASNTF